MILRVYDYDIMIAKIRTYSKADTNEGVGSVSYQPSTAFTEIPVAFDQLTVDNLKSIGYATDGDVIDVFIETPTLSLGCVMRNGVYIFGVELYA